MLTPALAWANNSDSDLSCPPAEVRAYVEREAGCGHWAGEEPYNKERALEINAALTQLQCDKLPQDKKRLHHQYATNNDIQMMLKDYNSYVAAYPKAKDSWLKTMSVYCK